VPFPQSGTELLVLRYGTHIAVDNLSKRGGELHMLYWAVIFLVIAIIAGILGFGGIAGAATGIARVLFFIFLILLLVSLVAGRRFL